MTDIRQRRAPAPAPAPAPPSLALPITTVPPPRPSRLGRQRRSPSLNVVIALLVSSSVALYLYFPAYLARTSFVKSRGQGPDRISIDDPENRVKFAPGEVTGHGDFGDGRKTSCKKEFTQPESEALRWVNVMLGNGGPEPNLSGGMIPAVAPPFGMTRWSPQTRDNYVSMCPYNQTDTKFLGFIGTHQPAIWMGESGPTEISAGLGLPTTDYRKSESSFRKEEEYASPNYYRNLLNLGGKGDIEVEMSATSRVGHMRYTFNPSLASFTPNVVLRASRKTWLLHGDQPDDKVPYYPNGYIEIDAERGEVHGWNNERLDRVLVGDELPAKEFKAYFVARFSEPWEAAGVANNFNLHHNVLQGEGKMLAGYVQFAPLLKSVEVRVGVSFISIEQARRNIDLEIPDGRSLAETSRRTRSSWAKKLDTLSVTGATHSNLTVLYSSFAHTLVYPYEISEFLPTGKWAYYSGYLDRVVEGISYSGYSIWDTFRAQTAWLLLVAPERVGEMIQSMIQDWREGGWLPMWKNVVETNIMVGTHADSIIAQAMKAGVRNFDWDEAWQAVRKNAFSPPDRDTELQFGDREEGTPQEVRAGLTEYMKLGYVAADLHSESGSRTLDYAYDDHAAAIVASMVGAKEDAEHIYQRSKNYRNLYHPETGHMEARNIDGSWAGSEKGWTEGDHWAYTLDVMHDIPGLINLMGGEEQLVKFLDDHFEGGHNLHTNEPSHHIPYMYTLAGAAHKTQEWVRKIGESDYNHTADGLSGNEDCGQMSAWYLFSALGFYPVDPANATYILGAPYFDHISLHLPNNSRTITISAKGASGSPMSNPESPQFSSDGGARGLRYVKNLTIAGELYGGNVIDHRLLVEGGQWVWTMDDKPQVPQAS